VRKIKKTSKMKSKTIEISIGKSNTLSKFSKLPLPLFKNNNNLEYDFSGVLELRQLLNHEKIRLLNMVKTEHPKSIYELAKKLGRGFKSVNDDIRLLERLGFIDLIEEKTKNRRRYRPELAIDTLTINLRI
jgi:predicted transcriptional regulator